MTVCDRCKTSLMDKEEFEISAWDEGGINTKGKDDVESNLCRRCFDDFKRWLHGWLTGGVLKWDMNVKHKQSRRARA